MVLDLSLLTEEQRRELVKSAKLVEGPRLASPWMSPVVTAEYLGIALGTLRNWTSARFIPFSKKGRVVRYNRDAIDLWLANGGCPGRTTLADL